jgi:hypothetical protein
MGPAKQNLRLRRLKVSGTRQDLATVSAAIDWLGHRRYPWASARVVRGLAGLPTPPGSR